MYKKVIVLEIKEAYVLAMEEGGAVVRIKKKDGLHVGMPFLSWKKTSGKSVERLLLFQLLGAPARFQKRCRKRMFI